MQRVTFYERGKGGRGVVIPFHAQLLTKFTSHIYLKQKIHESGFFSRYLHTSRSSFIAIFMRQGLIFALNTRHA